MNLLEKLRFAAFSQVPGKSHIVIDSPGILEEIIRTIEAYEAILKDAHVIIKYRTFRGGQGWSTDYPADVINWFQKYNKLIEYHIDQGNKNDLA